jgi:uncharacterized membrane protein YhaH (DUF805 family)
MLDEPKQQPFLPRVGMIWFFIAVTIVAIALGVVRAAEQGRALAAAMVFIVIFIGLCGLCSAACFLTAFLLGAVEKAIVGPQETPASPFSDGSLPEQIVPPKPADGT